VLFKREDANSAGAGRGAIGDGEGDVGNVGDVDDVAGIAGGEVVSIFFFV